MEIVFIYVTCPGQEVADILTKILLEKKLIACANVFPIISTCVWQKAIEQTTEVVILLKTQKSLYTSIEQVIVANHPYKVPAIIMLPVTANLAFVKWVIDETTT